MSQLYLHGDGLAQLFPVYPGLNLLSVVFTEVVVRQGGEVPDPTGVKILVKL
jgi:hypothetical protein